MHDGNIHAMNNERGIDGLPQPVLAPLLLSQQNSKAGMMSSGNHGPNHLGAISCSVHIVNFTIN